MSYKFEEGKDVIIDAIINKSQHQKGKLQYDVFAEFVRQFYGTVALEDLQAWAIDDLYGAVTNFLTIIHQRAPKEIKTRIYNP